MAYRGRFLSPKFVASEDLGSGFDADFLGLTSIGGGESHRGPYTGVKALMLAVLDNGITCYMSHVPRLRAEAEHWVNSKRGRSPFCFPVVCEMLGLEPDAVRAELRRWREADTSPARALTRRRPNASRTGRGPTRETP
ncbi:MAG TPA: hypothetical protein VMW56_31690 [Candidatus Margulisiibacteriota bacterium]|nr:hypothetical protein [Candidatus Margulisiibacteriota bacterium]